VGSKAGSTEIKVKKNQKPLLQQRGDAKVAVDLPEDLTMDMKR